MLEKILNQEGTKKLTTEEKKTIEGGSGGPCPPNQPYGKKCWEKDAD
ncbi:hypothetical protein NJT12_22540 [Flavobacterium sp. AC]|uniref:Bacteriocin-type signal sequence-containing protein n=1 Tax=Flavobacterium azizsancarii TaxID=2961580 RepID=A0ABT4WII4_9FLAO|nr:hypothetical protein [Flavobacterium azizsancarii]MDA6072408.1 hypothetical protein [Flavobacterium azizsancarii]